MPKNPLSRTPLSRKLLCAVLCAVSLSIDGAPAAAQGLPGYAFIHITGNASQMAIPDIATLDFEIAALDADPAAARAVLEARLTEARALMQQLGLDPDDVVAREVRQSEPKDRQPQSGPPVYELRCDVHIAVRNVSNWAALAGGLLGKPNLDGFASSFDLSTIDQVDDELVIRAIQDARRRAGVMAAADGRRLGALMAATPQELKNLTTSMGLQPVEFRSRGNGAFVRPSETDRDRLLIVQALKLHQQVDVVFRLEGGAPGKRSK